MVAPCVARVLRVVPFACLPPSAGRVLVVVVAAVAAVAAVDAFLPALRAGNVSALVATVGVPLLVGQPVLHRRVHVLGVHEVCHPG